MGKKMTQSKVDGPSGGPSEARSVGNPVHAFPSIDLNLPADALETVPVNPERPSDPDAVPVDRQRTSDEELRERYASLLTRLRENDSSSRDNYEQLLRSVSSDGLRQIASELEERAKRLAEEENREIRRMMSLNLFAKKSPAKNKGASSSSAKVPKGSKKK